MLGSLMKRFFLLSTVKLNDLQSGVHAWFSDLFFLPYRNTGFFGAGL
jgi:hypothetical protein